MATFSQVFDFLEPEQPFAPIRGGSVRDFGDFRRPCPGAGVALEIGADRFRLLSAVCGQHSYPSVIDRLGQ